MLSSDLRVTFPLFNTVLTTPRESVVFLVRLLSDSPSLVISLKKGRLYWIIIIYLYGILYSTINNYYKLFNRWVLIVTVDNHI